MSQYTASSVDLGIIICPPGKQRRPSQVAAAAASRDDDEPVNKFSSAVDRSNLTLESNLLENEQLLEVLYDVQMEAAVSSQEILQQRVGTGEACATAMATQYRWPIPSAHTKDTVIDGNDLRVTKAVMRALLRQIKHFVPVGDEGPPESADVTRTPKQEGLYPLTRQDSSISESGMSSASSALTTISLPNGLLRAPAVADGEATSGRCWAKVPWARSASTASSRACARRAGPSSAPTPTTQYIRDRLLDHEPTWDGLLDRYQRIKTARDEATAREDFILADAKCNELLDAAERSVLAAWDRVNTCMLSSANDGNFRSLYEKLRDLLKTRLTNRRAVSNQVHSQAKADIVVCNAKAVLIDEENTRAANTADTARAVTERKIAQNAKQQKEIWDRVGILMADLQGLGQERSAMVGAHMTAIEEEARRRRHYAEHSEVLRRHIDHLTSVATVCEASVQLLNSVDDFTESAFMTIETRSFDEGLSEIRAKELSRFQNVYTTFVVNASERSACYTNRATIIGRNMNMLDMNCSSILATLDIHSRVSYKEHRRQLEADRVSAAKALASVGAREQSLRVYWAEVATSLRAVGRALVAAGGEDVAVTDMDELKESVMLRATAGVMGAVADAAAEERVDVSTAEEALGAMKRSVEVSEGAIADRRRGRQLKVVPSPSKSAATPNRNSSRGL